MSLILYATNISKLAAVSDYTYEVLVGDGTRDGSTSITHGTLKGHHRADGWKELIQKILNQTADEEFIDHRTRLIDLGDP